MASDVNLKREDRERQKRQIELPLKFKRNKNTKVEEKTTILYGLCGTFGE